MGYLHPLMYYLNYKETQNYLHYQKMNWKKNSTLYRVVHENIYYFIYIHIKRVGSALKMMEFNQMTEVNMKS